MLDYYDEVYVGKFDAYSFNKPKTNLYVLFEGKLINNDLARKKNKLLYSFEKREVIERKK